MGTKIRSDTSTQFGNYGRQIANDVRSAEHYPINQAKQLARGLERAPLIGKSVKRIGHVAEILSYACQPTPEIWIKAFFHAIPIAVWTYFQPDPVDFLTERFGEPHCGGHGGRITSNANDLLQKVPAESGLDKAVLRGIQLTQRIGWYFLIADVSTGFVVNWVSNAYLWSGCFFPGAAYAEGHAGPDDVILGGAGEQLFRGWRRDSSHIFEMDGATIATPAVTSCGAGCSLETGDGPIPGVEWGKMSTVILRDDVSGTDLETSEMTEMQNGHQYSLSHHIEPTIISVTHSYRAYVNKNDKPVWVFTGHFSASGDSGQAGMEPIAPPARSNSWWRGEG